MVLTEFHITDLFWKRVEGYSRAIWHTEQEMLPNLIRRGLRLLSGYDHPLTRQGCLPVSVFGASSSPLFLYTSMHSSINMLIYIMIASALHCFFLAWRPSCAHNDIVQQLLCLSLASVRGLRQQLPLGDLTNVGTLG